MQLAQVRHGRRQLGDVLNQGQPGPAHRLVLRIDQHRLEEAVDGLLEIPQHLPQDLRRIRGLGQPGRGRLVGRVELPLLLRGVGGRVQGQLLLHAPDDAGAAGVGGEGLGPPGLLHQLGQGLGGPQGPVGVVPPDGQDRLHHVVREAPLQEHALEPALDEVLSSGQGLVVDGHLLVEGCGPVQPFVHAEIHLRGQQVVDDPQGRPAQAKGIRTAPGRHPHAEETGQAVQLVRQAQGQAGQGAGRLVPGEAGQVVLPDGPGHLWRLPALQRVDLPHDALEAGHLDDHGGDQVRLAEGRSPPGHRLLLLRGPQHLGDLGRQLLQPVHLVQHGAQLLVEGEGGQPGGEALQGLGRVVTVEEVRVRVASPDHPLVPGPHHAWMGQAVGVGHGDEIGQELLRLRGDDREVALVFLHHRDEDRLGQLQEALLEGAPHREGSLHQVRHLVQQSRVLRRDAPHLLGQAIHLLLDALTPLLPVQDHALGRDRLQVGVRRGDGEGGEAARGQVGRRVREAGPSAHPATGHPGPGEGHHLVAEEGHHPAQGPGKAHVGLVPAHGLVPTQAVHELGEELGQHLLGRAPLHPLHRVDVVVPHHQVGHVHPLAAGEAQRGLGGLALGVEGPVRGWASPLHLLVRLAGGQLLDQGHQPPGRAGDGQRAVVQPGLLQEPAEEILELLDAVDHVRWGQLLGPQLQEQGLGRGDRDRGFGLRLGHASLAVARACVQAVLQPGELQALALLHVELRHLTGLAAHVREELGPLGHADGAPGVQDVEGVALAQDVVVGGGHQPSFDAGLGLGLVELVELLLPLHVGQLEVVDAVLDLLLPVDLAVGVDAVEVDGPDLVLALEVHGDALQAVGDLHAHRVQGQAAGLLEVGELGDLLAVQPDLPAQAPGPQRGGLPVVLHEADVVAGAVQADGLQAAQVELLGVARVRLEDDLVLGVHLHAVGVLRVAAIVRPEGGLHVGHVPGLRPQDAQGGGRVHGPRAHLLAVGLPDGAALGGPVLVEPHDDVLEREGIGHGCLLKFLSSARSEDEYDFLGHSAATVTREPGRAWG